MRRAFPLIGALTLIGAIQAQPQLLVPLATPKAPPSRVAPMMAPRELTEAEKAAQRFRTRQIKGRELSAAVRRVNRELDWFDDLDAAAEMAQQRQVPIVWIQALGDVGGYT